MAGGGEREPDEEGLAPVDSVHVAQRDDPAEHGDHAEGDVGEHGLFFTHARFLKYPRAVVHDGVDAGELLGHGDPDADQDDAYKPPVCQDCLPADDVLGLLFLGDELHLTEFGDGAIIGTHGLQYRERVVVAALLDEPSRRLRHPQHADEQRDSGQRAHPEHEAPDPVDVTPHGADDRVAHEGGELTGDDCQLVAPGDRSADLVGCQLREEYRDDCGGTSDRETENDSASHEDTESGRRECTGFGSGR